MLFTLGYGMGIEVGTTGEVEFRHDSIVSWYPNQGQSVRRLQLVGEKWVAYDYTPKTADTYGSDTYKKVYAAVSAFAPGLYEVRGCNDWPISTSDKVYSLYFFVHYSGRTQVKLTQVGDKKALTTLCERGWWGDLHRYDAQAAIERHLLMCDREEAGWAERAARAADEAAAQTVAS